MSTSAGRTKLTVPVIVALVGLALSFFLGDFSVITKQLHRLLIRRSDRPVYGVQVFDSKRKLTFRGVRRGRVDHFQNIFYGQDTSGQNRFAPPVPYEYSVGSTVDATQEGAWCPQAMGGPPLPFTSAITNTSENCLSLRIARPSNIDQNSKLPVAVWLHGGGHALGSASDVLYTPDGLIDRSVEAGQPIIFVGINYRLGVFGFATNRWLQKSKYTNVGLRDQRAALDWVASNIHLFGGDPSRVTAIGQSVGASDIGLHLTSFAGKKGVPFQRAVMMSGGTGLNFNTKNDLVANNTAAVVKALDCDFNGVTESQAAVKCLQDKPLDQVMNISVAMMREARPPFGEGFFHPTFDNDYIPDRPSELLRNGNFVKNIPHIASWVANDGAWYAPPSAASDFEVTSSFTLWMRGLSYSSIEKLLSLYPVGDFEHMIRPGSAISPQYYRAAQMNRDLWFTCPVLDFTWQYIRHGGGVEYSRIYQMNQTRFGPAYEVMGVPFWRVAHLSDIPYVLNSPDFSALMDSSKEQKVLSKQVSSQIIAFVNEKGIERSAGSPMSIWEPAYADHSKDVLKNGEFPHTLKLNLFGGPYGSGMASISKLEGPTTERDEALAKQKLLTRCEFINSALIRQEISV